MLSLQKEAKHELIDYVQLMSLLADYKAPHRKISGLLKSKVLIRIKKGLYVLGEEYRNNPINLAIVANLIYGPSYVSQEFALQYYGLIPERVEVITSMTNKRNKIYVTPIGRFTYTYLNTKKFQVGINWQNLGGEVYFLMASPEKAIADILSQHRSIKTVTELQQHLIENMRVDETDLKKLDPTRLAKIATYYAHPTVTLFNKYIQGI